MRRPFIVVLAVLLAGAALLGGSFFVVKQVFARQMATGGDPLAWLRDEFRLGDAEMARIRQLHEGYLPQCGEMCARIAAKKMEAQEAMAAVGSITPYVEKKLVEVAVLRAQCQTQMLRHFQEVSQSMPPEQGRRYLEEMWRVTLGSHEDTEQSMSPAPAHGHH
jgi:hypothetical protein